MTNIKDIHCIDINWINSEITRLYRESNQQTNINPTFANICTHKAFMLESVLSQLKPIQPLISITFQSGIDSTCTYYTPDKGIDFDEIEKDKENYIFNKQFEI